MWRWMYAVILVLISSATCLAQQSFVGTYKLVSVTRVIDGTPESKPNKLPHGYMIVTPCYYTLFYTDGERKYGTSDKEKAALWDSMTAYSGAYRLEGNKVIVSVDTSWNEIYNGTQQVRDWEMQGKRLISSSPARPWGRDPSKKIVLTMEWEKVE
jgi:hypothetical protein